MAMPMAMAASLPPPSLLLVVLTVLTLASSGSSSPPPYPVVVIPLSTDIFLAVKPLPSSSSSSSSSSSPSTYLLQVTHTSVSSSDSYLAIGHGPLKELMIGANTAVAFTTQNDNQAKAASYFLDKRSAPQDNSCRGSDDDDGAAPICPFQNLQATKTKNNLTITTTWHVPKFVTNVSDVTFIFAHGTRWKSFHDFYGHARVNLNTGRASTVVAQSRRDMYALHGALMIAAWLGATPLASLAARALRFGLLAAPRWFWLHVSLQACSALWFLYAVALVLTGDDDGNDDDDDDDSGAGFAHKVIGLTVLALWCVQVLLGVLRPDAHGKVRLGCIQPHWRPAFLMVHRIVGAALLAGGATNCVLGGTIFSEAFGGGTGLLVVACVLLSIFVLAWVAAELAGLPARGRDATDTDTGRIEMQMNPFAELK